MRTPLERLHHNLEAVRSAILAERPDLAAIEALLQSSLRCVADQREIVGRQAAHGVPAVWCAAPALPTREDG